MEEAAPSRARGNAKRSSMACTTCRQVKLRCDATKCFPAPCTRCTRQNISCKFDPKFKRQPIRGSLEKVVKENERLRSLVHDSATSPSQSHPSPSLPPAGSDGSAPTGRSAPTGVLETSIFANYASQKPKSREIDGIELDSPTILTLFGHFIKHYLHHLPILNLETPIDSLWDDSPILFWTIVVISASKHPQHSNYFTLLQVPFKQLLSGYLVNSIRCIYTVQALLALCLWPLPVVKQQDDPSWDYCGMAVAAMLKLTSVDSNTNWPGSNAHFFEESLRFKTWLGCFAVSTELAAALALPPPMGVFAEEMIMFRSRVQPSLCDEFLTFLDIQAYATRAASLIGKQSTASSQRSLIGLLERDLASIEARIKSPSQRVKIGILAARLRLSAIPMISQFPSKAESMCSNTLSKAIWYTGFHTAIQIARIFAESSLLGDANSTDYSSATVTKYFPKHYFQILVMAGMYFINILAIDRHISTDDKILAQNHIKMVFQTLTHWSQEPRDEAGRVARVIDLLSRHIQSHDWSSELQEIPRETVPMSVITSGMRMAGMLRRRLPVPFAQSDTEPPAAWESELPELPEFLEYSGHLLEDDLLEWNTWLANMDDYFPW